MRDERTSLPPGVTFHPTTHGGETGRLVDAHDWSRTLLGRREGWPVTLSGYVKMILELRAPAIIFWGAEQTQIYNDGYAVIMGPRHPRYLGDTYRACWPDTYPTIYPWMRAVLDGGETVEVNRTHIPLTRHGFEEEAYFTFTLSPLVNDAGKIEGILQIVREMTAEVLAERRAATLRAIPVDGAEKALAGNRDDLPFFAIHLGAATAEGRVPTSVIDEVRAENRARRVEDAYVVPIRRTASEEPRGVAVLGISPRLRFDDAYERFFDAIAREIAATLAAEQERAALREAQLERQNLADYFAQAPLPLCILDARELRYLLANEPFEQLVGRPVVGSTFYEIFPGSDAELFVPMLTDVVESGRDFVGTELPFRDRLLDVFFHPVREHEGPVLRILVFVQDVTQQTLARKKVESLADELRDALRMRDEFLSIASHELRTPITAMKLQTQLAERRLGKSGDGDAATIAKLVARTNDGLARMHRLVEDMLDISRIQTGRLQLRIVSLNVAEVVHDTLERFGDELAAAEITVHVDVPKVAMVTADRDRLEQVLTNLLTNAIRYAPRGPLLIGVRSSADHCELTVRDRGPGIPVEDHHRIFQRFERLGSANGVSGLGLGLYIAREMIEAQGGSIRVESAPGEGARFVLRLPS